MLASVILLLGLLPLSDAELTLPFCAPEGGVDSLGFPESACAFTGKSCPAWKRDCKDACVINEARVTSTLTAEDRSFGSDWWSMCPRVAQMVDVLQPARRRKLLATDAQDFAKLTAALKPVLQELLKTYPLPDTSTSSPETLAGNKRTEVSQTAPAQYTLACPSPADVTAVETELKILASVIDEVFKANAAGEPLEGLLADWAAVLDSPNTWLTLANLFRDPMKINMYMTETCQMTDITDLAMKQLTSRFVEEFQTGAQADLLSVCLDTKNYAQDYIEGRKEILDDCKDPFDKRFDNHCLSADQQLQIISSFKCAASWAKLYKIYGDQQTFKDIATVSEQLHGECGKIESEEACLAAGLPQAATASRKLADAGFEALDENIAILATTIDQLHDSLPFKVSTDDLYTEPFEQERPKSIPVPIAETTIEVSPATVPAPAPVDEPDIVADTDEPLQDAEESTEKAAWWMDDPKLMAIGASVLGVFLLILCIISYCCCCRRTKRTPGSNATHADEAKSSQLGNSTIMDSEFQPGQTGTSQLQTSPFIPAPPEYVHSAPQIHGTYSPSVGLASGSASGGDRQAQTTGGIGVLGRSHVGPSGSTSGNSVSSSCVSSQQVSYMHERTSTEIRMLCEVLDRMHQMDMPFKYTSTLSTPAPPHPAYDLRSAKERIVQAGTVIQTCSLPQASDLMSIKFYVDRKAYANEQYLHSMQVLKPLLQPLDEPQVFISNSDSVVRGPGNYVFPPYTICDAGEPLHSWMSRYPTDHNRKFLQCSLEAVPTALRALQALHSEGYTHRTVRPGVIMRRQRYEDWVLSDFGIAESTGASAPPISMPWHLSYSAPEVVSDPNLPAHQQNPVTVDPSADMYSVGVIAYELLTQQRVFPDGCSDSDIREALTAGADGVGGLPWEQGVSGSLERNRKIPKPLRHAVLACLDRDVENRLSAASLLSLWESAPWERIIDELRAEVTN